MTFLGSIFGSPSTKQTSSSSGNSSPQTTVSRSSTDGSTTPGQPGKQDKFSFLLELTGSQQHRGKPFYQHLYNVYTHLKEIDASEEVCDAGLFHSIYGTEFYRFQNNRITRDVVRGLIGNYAEELVHIFCTSKDRFRVIVNNTLGLSRQQVIDLCYIEFANLFDQNQTGYYNGQLQILSETLDRLQNDG